MTGEDDRVLDAARQAIEAVDTVHQVIKAEQAARAHAWDTLRKWAKAYPDYTADRTAADDALFAAYREWEQAEAAWIGLQRGEG